MSLADASAAGLKTEQAPPLSIPGSFFVTVPLCMVAAGALLAWNAAEATASSWTPAALATTHLGTLGVVGSAMLGALYQMIPVVAGAPVPAVRLAHAVHGLWLVGLSALVVGFAGGPTISFSVAFGALAMATLLFVVPIAVALARAPSDHEAVMGMRVAVLALVVVAGFGLRMAWGWIDGAFPADRVAWLAGHAAVGLLGWVGGLIFAVSLQVVPMFYLAPAVPTRLAKAGVAVLALSVVAVSTAVLAGGDATMVALAALPGALVVWLLQPVLTLRSIARRKRRRKDISLDFWRFGLVVGLLLLVAAAATWLHDDSRWPLLLGWLAIYGWAAMIVHGMLTRIVPFLVWFHRFAPLAGKRPVPAMRQLLPVGRSRPAFLLHGAAVVLGALAIVSGWRPLGVVAGLCLMGAGVGLGYGLALALARRSESMISR